MGGKVVGAPSNPKQQQEKLAPSIVSAPPGRNFGPPLEEQRST